MSIPADWSYRLLGLAIFLYCARRLWNGLSQQGIEHSPAHLLDFTNSTHRRSSMPIRYWIHVGLEAVCMIAGLVVAILGYSHSGT